MKPLALLATLLLLTQGSLASPANEEFIFRAERAIANLDEKSGHARYEGNAELIQGKRSLKAHVIDFETRDGQVTRVEAKGSPVSLTDEDQQLKAQANNLTYNVAKQTLFLKGNAKIDQQGRQFEGEELEYDLNARRIRATGGGDGGRIKLVIPAAGNPVQP